MSAERKREGGEERVDCVKDLELDREEFIARLIEAGWRREEAEREWDDIQSDEEGTP